MHEYEVSFYLNGSKYIETVKAFMRSDAEKLIKTKYKGEKVTSIFIKQIS